MEIEQPLAIVEISILQRSERHGYSERILHVFSTAKHFIGARAFVATNGIVESILAAQLGYETAYNILKQTFRGTVGTSVTILIAVNNKLGKQEGRGESKQEQGKTRHQGWVLSKNLAVINGVLLLVLPQTLRAFSSNVRAVNYATLYGASVIPSIPMGLGLITEVNFVMSIGEKSLGFALQASQNILSMLLATMSTLALGKYKNVGLIGLGFASSLSFVITLKGLRRYYRQNRRFDLYEIFKSVPYIDVTKEGAGVLLNEGIGFAATVFVDFLLNTVQAYGLQSIDEDKFKASIPSTQLFLWAMLILPALIKAGRKEIAVHLGVAERAIAESEYDDDANFIAAKKAIERAYFESNDSILTAATSTGAYALVVVIVANVFPTFFPRVFLGKDNLNNKALVNACNQAVTIRMATTCLDVARQTVSNGLQGFDAKRRSLTFKRGAPISATALGLGLYCSSREEGPNIIYLMIFQLIAMLLTVLWVGFDYNKYYRRVFNNPRLLIKEGTCTTSQLPGTVLRQERTQVQRQAAEGRDLFGLFAVGRRLVSSLPGLSRTPRATRQSLLR